MHFVLLLFALFASLFTLQKEALNYVEPFFLIGSRMTIAGVLLSIYAFKFSKEKFKLKVEYIAPLFLLGLANIYLTNIFEIWGLSNMNSSKACLIYSLSPFLSALIAFVVLKEKLNKRKWIGMIIGFIGLIPILYTQTESEIATGKVLLFTLAEISLLLAVVCSVYGWIMLKKVVSQHEISPISANGISMLIGGIIALCHSYFSGETWQPVPVSNTGLFLAYSFIMIIISNLVCYNLYGHLLKRFSATFMSFSGLVTPLFASLFGYLFLQEKIDKFYFVSILLFACGLTIFYLEEIAKNKEINKSSSDINKDAVNDEYQAQIN